MTKKELTKMVNGVKRHLRNLEKWEKQCEGDEYTDSGEAWEQINDLRRTVRDLLKVISVQ